MAQSLAKIVLHLVYSTKNRETWIEDSFRSGLHAYLAGAYRVGDTDDHVHIACTLPRTLTVSKLLEEIKKSSSVWVKNQDDKLRSFAWQAGYGAFSVGASQVPVLLSGYEHKTGQYCQGFLVSMLCVGM